MEHDAQFDARIRAALIADRPADGPHPPADELVRYHLGELPPAEVETLQDHLALCRECTNLVLGAEEFLAADEADEVDAGLVPAAAGAPHVSAQRAHRADVVPLRPRDGARTPAPRPPAVQAPMFLRAAAVFLGATTLGLAGYSAMLRGDLSRATAPIDTSIVMLNPEPERGPGEQGTRGDVDRGPGEATASRKVLRGNATTLVIPTNESAALYGVWLLALPGSRVVWARDVPPAADGSVSIALPPNSLPVGRYEVRVLPRGGTAASVAQIEIVDE